MAASETRFDALGRSWRFKYGIGAICRIEAAFDLPFARALQQLLPNVPVADMANPKRLAEAALDIRLSDIREVFGAAIVEVPTADEVDEIIDELGMDEVRRLVSLAFASDVAPAKGKRGAATEKKRAPRPRSSTRTRS